MRLSVKKKIVMAGAVLFIGMSAITSQAASVVNFSTGDQNVKAHANGNINSAVFTYGGFRSGSYDNKYAVARMFVERTSEEKSYEPEGKKLQRQAFSKQRTAYAKDEKGIKLTVKTYDSNGQSELYSAERTMRCR